MCKDCGDEKHLKKECSCGPECGPECKCGCHNDKKCCDGVDCDCKEA